jgi:hypothetical protein
MKGLLTLRVRSAVVEKEALLIMTMELPHQQARM